MADVHDKATRSYNMSRIRSKDTSPEMIVRTWLFAKGYRYRLHVKTLPGKPDIVLPKYLTAIFIHGCFWHGHDNCKFFVVPKTRTQWWLDKISKNKMRDNANIASLSNSGWRVKIVYECELKKNKIDKTLRELLDELY